MEPQDDIPVKVFDFVQALHCNIQPSPIMLAQTVTSCHLFTKEALNLVVLYTLEGIPVVLFSACPGKNGYIYIAEGQDSRTYMMMLGGVDHVVAPQIALSAIERHL